MSLILSGHIGRLRAGMTVCHAAPRGELPPDERLFSPELAQDIITGFDGLMPLYKYFDALCAAEAAGEK